MLPRVQYSAISMLILCPMPLSCATCSLGILHSGNGTALTAAAARMYAISLYAAPVRRRCIRITLISSAIPWFTERYGVGRRTAYSELHHLGAFRHALASSGSSITEPCGGGTCGTLVGQLVLGSSASVSVPPSALGVSESLPWRARLVLGGSGVDLAESLPSLGVSALHSSRSTQRPGTCGSPGECTGDPGSGVSEARLRFPGAIMEIHSSLRTSTAMRHPPWAKPQPPWGTAPDEDSAFESFYDYFCGGQHSDAVHRVPLLERLMEGFGENVPASPLPPRRHHSHIPSQVLSGELLRPHGQDHDVFRTPRLPTPRRRGRPRKSAPPGWLPRTAPALAQETPGASDSDAPAKRPRGRPRKYPIDVQHKETPLHTPNWTRVSATDRPPRFPETHVLITRPARPAPPPWHSPDRRAPRPPAWQHFLRPVAPNTQGTRYTEPVPAGEPTRTPQDYVALRHWQLVNMARGRQLNERRLWELYVARRRSRVRAASVPLQRPRPAPRKRSCTI